MLPPQQEPAYRVRLRERQAWWEMKRQQLAILEAHRQQQQMAMEHQALELRPNTGLYQ